MFAFDPSSVISFLIFGSFSLSPQIAEHADKMNSYVMSLISYFRSAWPEIRGAAAMLLGKSFTQLSVNLALLLMMKNLYLKVLYCIPAHLKALPLKVNQNL